MFDSILFWLGREIAGFLWAAFWIAVWIGIFLLLDGRQKRKALKAQTPPPAEERICEKD